MPDDHGQMMMMRVLTMITRDIYNVVHIIMSQVVQLIVSKTPLVAKE